MTAIERGVGCKNVESPPSSIAKISLVNAVQLSPRRTPLRVQLLSGRFLAFRVALSMTPHTLRWLQRSVSGSLRTRK